MRSKTSASILLIGVFILGGITGAVSYSLYRSRVEASGPRAGPRWSSNDIVKKFAQDLNLGAEQQEQLKKIGRASCRERQQTGVGSGPRGKNEERLMAVASREYA